MCYGCAGGERVTPHALIPLKDSSATYGRRVELTYQTRKENTLKICVASEIFMFASRPTYRVASICHTSCDV